ncbi:hypothetical protein [Shewanella fidelis]|uniref:Iron-regulated membrane protein n=1 Tax=Shewanella fidelis TaxID=173509 RepID=A0AAW8NK00_9GAMM|nr:hypothetical protein [Shewanella fidelis]MDR8522521.1 hypothetical protein [Shewanella fidelis]MDW4812945.1 hypothetical protein [Shewanella fidelis]MDW4816796.1 hypothetical protein [Shewanella fidelis]MDW4820952.1 hypothetical protein [Shewanella fidelis]MDW4825513.1 hypothetical protein [Shewanella fidelis]
MARLLQQDKIQPHWWRKSIIALLLGLTFSYGVVATFAWFGPGGIDAPVKVQFNMWLISFIWLPILAFSFLFRTAKTALICMLGANSVIYLLFFIFWWFK